ncbi:MAG: hypothetical protein JO057_16405 [Chloroflexi bacterium]|nr:hypothetical protein [Chloroflexota bacterium]
MSTRLPRWLGKLLAPAEDPRRVAAFEPGALSDVETLLAELRRSRAELARLRACVSVPGLGRDLADQEQALIDAEHNLQQSVDERRARAALLEARRRAAEAELWADI